MIQSITMKGPNGHTATITLISNRGALGYRIEGQGTKTTYFDTRMACEFIKRFIHVPESVSDIEHAIDQITLVSAWVPE